MSGAGDPAENPKAGVEEVQSGVPSAELRAGFRFAQNYTKNKGRLGAKFVAQSKVGGVASRNPGFFASLRMTQE